MVRAASPSIRRARGLLDRVESEGDGYARATSLAELLAAEAPEPARD